MHFVFYGKTHTHTPILCVATATIYLTYPKHTQTHTHTHAHSEYCRTREKSAAATRWVSTLLIELLSDCRTPISAFVCVSGIFSLSSSSFYIQYTLYMCARTRFFIAQHITRRPPGLFVLSVAPPPIHLITSRGVVANFLHYSINPLPGH